MDYKQYYGISNFEERLCRWIRGLRNNTRCPKLIRKYSNKKYGRLDSLTKYYIATYDNIPIGRCTYGYESLNLYFYKRIGAYTSIAYGQIFVAGNHHMEFTTTSNILTSPSFGYVNEIMEGEDAHSIEIGNDVWIGAGCMIFPHVKIGDGAVIGAGSIIRKDVPPYAVVVGVDRIIKYRFSDEIISQLLKIKWWDWSEDKIKANVDKFYDPEILIDAVKKGNV